MYKMILKCNSGSLENRALLKTLQPCKLHCCHMKSFNKIETPTFVLLYNLCFQEKPLYFFLSFMTRSVHISIVNTSSGTNSGNLKVISVTLDKQGKF